MKNRASFLLLAALLIVSSMLCLSACQSAQASDQAAAEQTQGAETASTKPSGFSDGNVQREYVFVDGRLYVYDDEYQETLPTGAVLRGAVAQSDSTKLPEHDFAAANVPVGANVYAPAAEPGDQIFVQISDTRFERFVLSD